MEKGDVTHRGLHLNYTIEKRDSTHGWPQLTFLRYEQDGITCGAIDEPKKSSKAIEECIIMNFCDKNVVIASFRDKNVYR